MKTIADQIKDLENTRAAKAARMQELMTKATEEGRTLDGAEGEEFDTLDAEVKTVDSDLTRLRRLESLNVNRASPVQPAAVTTSTKASDARGGAPAIVTGKHKDEKFAGQNYTRLVIARALRHLSGGEISATAIAMKRWGRENPMIAEIIRAGEIAGGGTGSGEWGAELLDTDARYTGDFIEYLNKKTLFFQLPLREVPANVTIKGQDGAATGYWVGQSKPIPVSAQDYSAVTLTPLKVAALAVVSNELLRDSSPSAEMLVRDALVEASAQRIDATFFSATAASNGVSPAGILNGVTAIGTTGPDGDNVRGDIRNLYAPFLAAYNAAGLVLAMNPGLAKSLQLMVNALGQAEFPNINAMGGTLLGDQVFAGDHINAAHMILFKPSDIYRIGDMGVEVSISREAAIEQNSSPTGATDTPTGVSQAWTSMFQSESTAIKVVRPINYAKRRSGIVQYIDDAAYGVVSSS